MADEYIRLDTTIIAIDRLINEAATGTIARTLFKAKDTLYSQQRYVIDVQPVDRWISVDERLPKTGESVLVYVAINKNLKGFGECKPEIRIGWLDDGGEWALQFSNMDYSEVLCWLPLPELPKDGEQNG